MNKFKKSKIQNTINLPNGCTLYWEDNKVGGRTYYSDEVGGGVMVWDTALVDQSTLLAALTQENTLIFENAFNKDIYQKNTGEKQNEKME